MWKRGVVMEIEFFETTVQLGNRSNNLACLNIITIVIKISGFSILDIEAQVMIKSLLMVTFHCENAIATSISSRHSLFCRFY